MGVQTSKAVALRAEGRDGRAREQRVQRGRQRRETHAVETQHAALLLLLDCSLHIAHTHKGLKQEGKRSRERKEEKGRRKRGGSKTHTQSVRHCFAVTSHAQKTAIGGLFQHSKTVLICTERFSLKITPSVGIFTHTVLSRQTKRRAMSAATGARCAW